VGQGDLLRADDDPVCEHLAELHRAGWSVGDAAFVTDAGGLVWVVSGHNGENPIRAEGLTPAVAWRAACDQARALGMLGGWQIRPPAGEG
jgi:hypothetical protein